MDNSALSHFSSVLLLGTKNLDDPWTKKETLVFIPRKVETSRLENLCRNGSKTLFQYHHWTSSLIFFKNRNFRLPELSSPAPVLRWKNQVQVWRSEVMGITIPSFHAGRKYPGICPGPWEIQWGDSFTCPIPPHFSGRAFLAVGNRWSLFALAPF